MVSQLLPQETDERLREKQGLLYSQVLGREGTPYYIGSNGKDTRVVRKQKVGAGRMTKPWPLLVFHWERQAGQGKQFEIG